MVGDSLFRKRYPGRQWRWFNTCWFNRFLVRKNQARSARLTRSMRWCAVLMIMGAGRNSVNLGETPPPPAVTTFLCRGMWEIMLIHLEKLGKSFGEKLVLREGTASVERE